MALLGPRTAEEEEAYAREANELADQIPMGKLNGALYTVTRRMCHLPSRRVAKIASCPHLHVAESWSQCCSSIVVQSINRSNIKGERGKQSLSFGRLESLSAAI